MDNLNNPIAPPPDHGSDFDDFMSSITTPREHIEAPTPPPTPDADPGATDAPITDNDEETLNYFDYSPEHKQTALTAIYALDMVFGFTGQLISGMPADRYKQFADGKKPSSDFVDVTAALIKKYQVRLSLEAMFFTALAMIYGPSLTMAIADRRKVAEAEETQQEAEIARRAQMIADAKAQK